MSSTTWRTTRRATSPAGLGQRVAQAHQRRRQVHVGRDVLEHLGLEQQPVQAEPVDRVLLHDLHDPGREVRADLAQPARDRRRRPAQAAAAARRRPRPAHRRSRGRRRSRRTPVPSASSPPSTSRQRRSRSVSSSPSSLASGLPSSGDRASARRRARVDDRRGPAPSALAQPFAEAAALARGQDRERAAQQRQDVGEGVRRDAATQPSSTASSSGSWTSTRPDVPMKPSIQDAPRSGSSPGESARDIGARRVEPARVVQQPGRAAGERAGQPLAAATRAAPRATRAQVGVLEQRERGVDAVDGLGELRGRLLVGADARARQADRDRAARSRAALRDRARVAAAHVAVAQDRRPAAGRRPSARRCRGRARRGRRARAARPRARPAGRRAGPRRRARPARRRSPPRAAARLTRAAAAAATVVPQRPAWISSSASSGCHRAGTPP